MDTNSVLLEPMEGMSVGCGVDSNAILLPNRKKTKNNGKNQQCGKAKTMERSHISKSQKRKLQKLEEEKKKEALVSESIKTLEKYKIQEYARSLLLSSGKIGQVETTLEKRMRAVQFSKVGLVSPHIDRPSKKRGREIDSYQSKPDPDESHLMIDHHDVEASSESFGPYQESVSNLQGIDDSCSNAVATEEISNGTDDINVPKDDQCNCEEIKNTNSQNKDVNDFEVNCEKIADCVAPRPCTVPIVVHVTRPNDIEEKRKDLPIVMMEQEIMEAINEHSTVIICGETGCGKTTQVPQFLYEAGFGSNKHNDKKGIIGVTQPRRVAVLATAKRVAFELGLHLGKEVGFQVRHDRRVGGSCSIKFMTDGILLREVQTDFLLKRYSIILLDEAHERSLNTDILIGMLSRVIQVRQKLYREQQEKILAGVKISPEDMISPLKLVLMSATLRVEDFVSGSKLFREPPPIMEVPTRQFPVTIHFSKRTEIVDYIGQAFKKVMSIHKRLPPGGILVFVTGQREVEYLCRKLRRASKDMSRNNSERQNGGKVTVPSETNPVEQEINMKEINEAFENCGHSLDQQTDRFSAYDEDPRYLDKDESYSSDDSENELGTGDDDSDFDDYGDFSNQKMLEKGGDLVNLQENAGNLSLLKEKFEASDEMNLPTPRTAEESSNVAFISGKKNLGPGNHCAGALFVLPLYAMLPAGAQLRVFEEVKEGERLVVVATNVAETSLTIPGITYVVDTGREKAKKYNSSNGMETYEVQWISKASAAQRAGRAGRTGPGHCYRLYSSAVFSNIFSDFSVAEISKIPVDGVVLLMKSMGIDKVANFPFPTPPEATALMEAERCLKSLEALDHQGRLTPLGKAMAHYPLSPRHSRMLLTVIHIMKNTQNYTRSSLLLGYTVAAAAALSLPNPFIVQFEGNHSNEDGLGQDVKSGHLDCQEILDRQEKLRKKKLKHMAKDARAKFSNPTSDALTTAYALQLFELAESPVEFCRDNLLHLKTMEEMSKLRKQLLQLVFQQKSFISDSHPEFAWNHGTFDNVEQAWRVYYDKHPLLLHEEELLGQAICAGWVDRVAKRIRVGSSISDGERKVNAAKYQACMVKETVFLHRWSSVARSAPELLVYSELLQTKRPYMHGVTSVKSEWLVKFASSLCNFSAPLTDPKPYYDPLNDQVLCWVSPTFGPHLWQLPLHSLPIKDKNLRVSVFAYALLEGHVLPCLRSVQKYLAAPPASFLRPEALGQKRIGNLLSKLQGRSKTIENRAMLKQAWNENPWELYSEILDWFQVGFHDQFEELWTQMHMEVLMDPKELFPNRTKREKRQTKANA